MLEVVTVEVGVNRLEVVIETEDVKLDWCDETDEKLSDLTELVGVIEIEEINVLELIIGAMDVPLGLVEVKLVNCPEVKASLELVSIVVEVWIGWAELDGSVLLDVVITGPVLIDDVEVKLISLAPVVNVDEVILDWGEVVNEELVFVVAEDISMSLLVLDALVWIEVGTIVAEEVKLDLTDVVSTEKEETVGEFVDVMGCSLLLLLVWV